MAEPKKINAQTDLVTVLISPLDWGLGHTTRCIPLIRACLNLSCNVIVACNSTQKKILSLEFPKLEYVDLRGYNVKYASNKWQTMLSLVLQVPKILTAINEEHKWIGDFLQHKKVDLIISDNRYGFYSSSVKSVLITHQLAIRSGFGTIADRLVSNKLAAFISRFDECWIPDLPPPDSLAPALSGIGGLAVTNRRYIGLLSRFTMQTADRAGKSESSAHKKLLIILSGPEPQRTKLENLLLPQLIQIKQPITFIRGTDVPMDSNVLSGLKKNITVINLAGTEQLQELINQAEFVVCRAGYSSIMDMMVMKKKTIMIPTPGQGEQEYLAARLDGMRCALCVQQGGLDLPAVLDEARNFDYNLPDVTNNFFEASLINALNATFAPA